MPFISLSIREAIERINSNTNGWFLPAIQRLYVWGNRHESELYICKLFDSILRGYPIGTVLIWNTQDKVPYKEFLQDYKIGDFPNYVDEGIWRKPDKWLVYDGQQRLQTLFSCLKYTINNRILAFDLLFNMDEETDDPNKTGFYFIDKSDDIVATSVKLNTIFSETAENKIDFIDSTLEEISNLNLNKAELKFVRNNLDKLWDIFVKTDSTKPIAYFSIENKKEDEVNEIFERLNTGGIPLSESDILFSKIKGHDSKYSNFDERLNCCSKWIYSKTGGYLFDHYSILQLLNLFIKGTIRIDHRKRKPADPDKYVETWEVLEKSLKEFFDGFISGQFQINNSSIIPRKPALYPLMIYFHENFVKGYKFRYYNNDQLLGAKKYFIISQINDWNIQTIVDNLSKIILQISKSSKGFFDFPIEEIIKWMQDSKKRQIELYEDIFADYIWFSLKILTPNRQYKFEPDISSSKFNPQIDHIFPLELENMPPEYKSNVDIIWNMQPVPWEINNLKRANHPQIFFSKKGAKYQDLYDFIPSKNLQDEIWEDPAKFIEKRRELMIDFLKTQYGITFKKLNKTS